MVIITYCCRQGDTLGPYLLIICLDYLLRTVIDKIKENSFKLTKEKSRRYPAKTITDADYTNDIGILANTSAQAEAIQHSLERAAVGIGLHINAHKTEYMYFNQTDNLSTLNGNCLKLVDKFIYLGSSVSSTKTDIDTRLTKPWRAIDRLSDTWKSVLTDKVKRSFFQAAVVSILLCGCTIWTLTKHVEKKSRRQLHKNAVSNFEQNLEAEPSKQQLYGYLPPIMKTFKIRRTRYAGHCGGSRDELISDVFLWTPSHGRAKVGRPART